MQRLNEFAQWLNAGALKSDMYLFIVFVLYVLSIFCFACFYFHRFRTNPDDFLLASEIHRWQIRRARQRLRVEASRTAAAIEALKVFRRAVDSGHITGEGSFPLEGAYNAKLTEEYNEDPQTRNVAAWSEITISDKRGNSVYFEQWWEPRLEGNIKKLTATSVEKMAARKDSITKRQQRLRHTPGYAWNFSDFIYFSTITQTTVGYGDILPNSTRIRMVVICQVILGYGLVAFLLTGLVARASN